MNSEHHKMWNRKKILQGGHPCRFYQESPDFRLFVPRKLPCMYPICTPLPWHRTFKCRLPRALAFLWPVGPRFYPTHSPCPIPSGSARWIMGRDSNPGPVFSIPGFGIGEFLIPGSRDPGGIMGSPWYQIKNRYYWVYGRPIYMGGQNRQNSTFSN